jgi:hypothetical protein
MTAPFVPMYGSEPLTPGAEMRIYAPLAMTFTLLTQMGVYL